MLLALALLALQDDEPRHVVQRGAITPVYSLDALLVPAEAAEVRIRVGRFQGDLRLKAVVPHGKTVKKGDLLMAVDPEPLEKQIAAEEHDLRLARAQLAKATADAELGAKADAFARGQAERAVADAETELKAWEEVTGKHLVQHAEMTVLMYEGMLQDQTEELDQLLKMYKSEELTNATAEIVVKRTRRALERIQVNLGMAREEARVVKEVRHPQGRRQQTTALESARQQLASLKAAQALSAVQREVELAKARAAAAEHEETLAELRADLAALSVRAPFDGRVFHGVMEDGRWTTERASPQLTVGEKIQAGQPWLTLCGQAVAARADLPEAHYFDVEEGMKAVVRPAATPGKTADGRVAARSLVASPQSGRFHARVELDAARADLFPGMTATVVIRGGERRDVLLVPSEAVQVAGDTSTVQLVSKDGKRSAKEVVVGGSDGRLTEVRDGLSEGDAVVLPK